MVLHLPYWELISAMAIVWFSMCACVSILSEFKSKRKHALVICAMSYAAVFALCVVMASVLSSKWFDLWRPVSLFLPLLILWPMVKDNARQLIFTYFSVLNATGFIVMASGLFASQFARPGYVLLPVMAAFFAIMLKAAARLKNPFRSIVESIGARNSAALMPLVFSVADMLLIGVSSRAGGAVFLGYAAAAAMFIAMCLCYMEIYITLRQGTELSHEYENRKLLIAQLRRQRDEMGMYESSRETASRIRHDIRHHANIVLSLLNDNNTAKAADYINGLIVTLEAEKVTQYCANYTVNAILSIYAERAEKRGIKVEINASVPPDLKISEMELASIYANAVENAVIGCASLPEGNDRSIRIFTSCREGKLSLQIRNTCDQKAVRFDDAGMPISPRTEGGTGTRSIRYVVEKHGGTWFFDVQNGIFTTSVVITGV